MNNKDDNTPDRDIDVSSTVSKDNGPKNLSEDDKYEKRKEKIMRNAKLAHDYEEMTRNLDNTQTMEVIEKSFIERNAKLVKNIMMILSISIFFASWAFTFSDHVIYETLPIMFIPRILSLLGWCIVVLFHWVGNNQRKTKDNHLVIGIIVIIMSVIIVNDM